MLRRYLYRPLFSVYGHSHFDLALTEPRCRMVWAA